MRKREYKEKLYKIFDLDVDNLDYIGKINYINKVLLEYQKDNEDKRDTSNKGEKWTDEQNYFVGCTVSTKLYEICYSF